MAFLHCDTETCISCGHCAAVCVSGAVGMNETGPYQAHEYCIACGHCVAVCPVSALENGNCAPGAEITGDSQAMDAEAAELFLRSRHSERCFLPKPVPRAAIEEMLDIARYAPTGGNTQGMQYLAIDRRDILDRILEAAFAWGREEQKNGSRLGGLMALFETRYTTEGRDTILWGAPCLIIASAQPGRFVPSARDSAIFSLLYAQLHAPSLGLATCWSGLVEAVAWAKFPAFLDILRPFGIVDVAGAIMAGYPKNTHHRLSGREPLHLSWADG